MFSPGTPSFQQPDAALAPPPFHHGAGGPPMPPPPPPFFGIPVRPVWAYNLDAEARAVRALAANACYVAVNVQYPGVVFHGGADPCALTAEERYAAVKANVDALKPLQLGLAVGTREGRCVAWEFNLGGFDRAADPHAPGSVAYLAGRGMDLDAHRARGVPVSRLADALRRCGLLRARRGRLPWVTYAGAYHVAYLLKILTGGQPLPGDVPGFLGAVRAFLGDDVYDVARLAVDCPSLPVGLERVANALGLAPPLWSPRLAGAAAALALQAFAALEFNVFRGDVSRYRGVLHGLQVT